MTKNHGGDIYRNEVQLDFSVNINPFGMPKEVEKALYRAVKDSSNYPDLEAEQLQKQVGAALGIADQSLLFGNGASELFMAIVHAIKPEKTVISVPSFSGYRHAAEAVESEIIYYTTKAEEDFRPGTDFFSYLTEEIRLLFLANPNNPTGKLLGRAYLKNVLEHCKKQDIVVVLDECFIEFCKGEKSMLPLFANYKNLILVRAFTKIFAIPGVRLGYLACSDEGLIGKIREQLPEWNLSVFAQAAGVACTKQKAYVEKTADYVEKERKFLYGKLQEMGIQVWRSEADFLLLYSERPLYEELLEKGILIRSCENFKGLGKGYFRIAVKKREENEILVEAIRNGRKAGGKV